MAWADDIEHGPEERTGRRAAGRTTPDRTGRRRPPPPGRSGPHPAGPSVNSSPGRSHGEWRPDPARPDPVELLEEQAATRVQELVPLRYGRMLHSPFTFYPRCRLPDGLRPRRHPANRPDGSAVRGCPSVQLRHVRRPDRRLQFGLNDFDETLPGPFEWDLKRLVTSFAVAGRDRSFDPGTRESLTLAVTRAYRYSMLRHGGDAEARSLVRSGWTSTTSANACSRR